MRFAVISDTHGLHESISVPDADVLIHAGDFCMSGKKTEAVNFLQWFSGLPHEFKVFIAGNHDFFFEQCDILELEKLIPAKLVYLNDSGMEIGGYKIWGSPVQPWFFDWAFNRQGDDIRKHWDLIPADTDILITHGPARNILDRTLKGEHVGCDDLREVIFSVRPRVHICGHIHEAHGRHREEGIDFINASILNVRYEPAFEAVVFDLP